jgi:hypothetical protein
MDPLSRESSYGRIEPSRFPKASRGGGCKHHHRLFFRICPESDPLHHPHPKTSFLARPQGTHAPAESVLLDIGLGTLGCDFRFGISGHQVALQTGKDYCAQLMSNDVRAFAPIYPPTQKTTGFARGASSRTNNPFDGLLRGTAGP